MKYAPANGKCKAAFAYFRNKVYFIFENRQNEMMQLRKNAWARWAGPLLTAAALIALYAAGTFRPLLGPDEYRNGLAASPDFGWAAPCWEAARHLGDVRWASAAAALAGVLAVWGFVRLHRPELAEPAALLTAVTGLWFFGGTAAAPPIFFALALVLAVLGASAALTGRGWRRLAAGAVALAGIAGLAGGWPILTRLPDFRRPEMMPLLLIGFLPLLLLVTPVYAGWRKLDLKSPLLRTALAGLALSLGAAWLGPAGFVAAAPFAAIVWVLSLEAVFAEPEGIARFDRVMRHWLVIVLAGALVLFLLQLGIQLKWLGLEYRLYRQPGKYVMALLVAAIVVGWWRYAIREARVWAKLRCFVVGFAILLMAAPTLLPDRTLERFAPAEALRAIELNDGAIAADADLIPALRYRGIAAERLQPIGGMLELSETVRRSGEPLTVVTRRVLPMGFPAPSRRFQLMNTGIRIWEYDRR